MACEGCEESEQSTPEQRSQQCQSWQDDHCSARQQFINKRFSDKQNCNRGHFAIEQVLCMFELNVLL